MLWALLASGLVQPGQAAQPELLPPPKGAVVPEVLPVPRPAAPPAAGPGALPPGIKVYPAPAYSYPPAFYRRSAYEVWQNLDVSSTGRWRPRVNLLSDEAYYRYNGQPYPTPYVEQRLYRPDIGVTPRLRLTD